MVEPSVLRRRYTCLGLARQHGLARREKSSYSDGSGRPRGSVRRSRILFRTKTEDDADSGEVAQYDINSVSLFRRGLLPPEVNTNTEPPVSGLTWY